MTLPDTMTPAIREVLGLPNFVCGPVAAMLRSRGHQIESRAEFEQAAVIWWLLPFAVEHGERWMVEAYKALGIVT